MNKYQTINCENLQSIDIDWLVKKLFSFRKEGINFLTVLFDNDFLCIDIYASSFSIMYRMKTILYIGLDNNTISYISDYSELHTFCLQFILKTIELKNEYM